MMHVSINGQLFSGEKLGEDERWVDAHVAIFGRFLNILTVKAIFFLVYMAE